MKLHPIVHPLCLSLLLTACGTTQPTNDPQIAAQDNSIAGPSIDTNSAESIRSSEQLKAYPAGRYQDPNNPQIMHEAHTVYRAEATPRWNLSPNTPSAVPIGPAVAVADIPMQTASLSGELEQAIHKQNQLLETTYEQNERLSQEIQKLHAESEKSKEILATKQKLEDELARKNAELEKIRQQEAEEKAKQPEPSFYIRWWNAAKSWI